MKGKIKSIEELKKLGDKKNILVFDVPDGYVITGELTVYLRKGEESFEEFVQRLDIFSQELRMEILEKMAQRLGLKVEFK